jgi:carbon storage regulator
MLVIPREKDESLIINDDITLTVIEVRDDKVRLGIQIPRGGTVHRREVYEAILGPMDDQDMGPPSPLLPGGNH